MSAASHFSFALMLQGTVDPRSVATPAPVGTIFQDLKTGALYAKTGNGDTAWMLIAALNTQSFIYTFNGAEPGFGTDTVTIPIGTMPNTGFQAIVTDAGRADLAQVFYTAPRGAYSTNTIQVICTGIPQAGDKIFVFVAALI
jgi:hypothetical protein